jgi:hypothetical protein
MLFVFACLFAATNRSSIVAQAPCDSTHTDLCDPCPYCPPSQIGTPPGVPQLTEPAEQEGLVEETPSLTPPPSLAFSEQAAAIGTTGFAVPNVVGENLGGGRGRSIIADVVGYRVNVFGFVISETPVGDPNGQLVFQRNPQSELNDFFSVGIGRDTNGDGFVDTFDITEPVPPANVPTAPGPDYTFDGGTASDPSNLPYQGGDTWTADYTFSRILQGEGGAQIVIPDPGGGLVVGRLKIAENSSPIPRDRVFFNYSMFDNVPLAAGGLTVNRFTPGFEKTTPNGMMSLECRFPFAATLDSNLVVDGFTDYSHVEFGDIFLSFKALLLAGRRGAISAGVSVTTPTADSVNVFLDSGKEIVRINNDSVHVMPFLGWLLVQDRWFLQGFVQVDVDANGNPVYVNLGRGLVPAGQYQDETFLYVDVNTGYWLWQADGCQQNRCLTGFAPIAELHLNRSLQNSDVITEGPFRIGEPNDDIQLLHLLLGGHFQLGPMAGLTVGYGTPIGNGPDQLFDGELRAVFNRFF